MKQPHHQDDGVTVYHSDSLDILPNLIDYGFDAVITDPPYELGFMGKQWDNAGIAFDTEIWQNCLRVLQPGGHLLAFGGSRTWHRLAVAIEDAGFEIRDSIAWLYGSGFPKSLDVSKAIDRAAGELTTESVGMVTAGDDGRTAQLVTGKGRGVRDGYAPPSPATDAAKQWQGWGTALKPAFEPIIVARKPFDGTVANNVQRYGTGALNIDATRVDLNGEEWGGNRENAHGDYSGKVLGKFAEQYAKPSNPAGRWPTNVVIDGDAADHIDAQSGTLTSGDSGGASRFFPTFRYQAKAPKSERPNVNGVAHPTVKPVELMRWLVKLVTPPGGVVFDPFAGSGTTVEAAILEGMRCVAVEREADYLPLIMQRIERANRTVRQQKRREYRNGHPAIRSG